MTPDQHSPGQDLRSILRMVWRWKLLILALVLGLPVLAYLIHRDDPKLYESSALVSMTSTPAIAGSGAPQANAQSVARLLTTSTVARIAARQLDPPGDASIAGAVTATLDPDTNFLTITATDQDPRRAADIAMAFAEALSVYQEGAARETIDRQIQNLEEQLNRLAPKDPLRAELEQQLNALRGTRGALGPGATVIEPAAPSSTPIGPGLRRDIEIALVIGILLAIGAVLAAESSDRRLRTSEELEQLTGLSLLSEIPTAAFRPSADDQNTLGAFQTLWATLSYFHIGRAIETVVVTSAGQQEGKTTVAVRLAMAGARAGKRVVLVDADLRRPAASERLGVPTTHVAGLAAVLVGEAQLSDALVQVPVEGASTGRMLLLPAGPAAANPAELLGSSQMSSVLKELASESDLVLVDTAAALSVSDAVPLFSVASGVILVARLNQSRREAVRRLQRVVESAEGTLLGVVATGTRGIGGYGGYGYRYDSYYDDQPRRRFPRLRRRRPAQPVVRPVPTPPVTEAPAPARGESPVTIQTAAPTATAVKPQPTLPAKKPSALERWRLRRAADSNGRRQ